MVRPSYSNDDQTSTGPANSHTIYPPNATGSNLISLLWVTCKDDTTLSHTVVSSVIQNPGGGSEAAYTKLLDTYVGTSGPFYRVTLWYLLDASFSNGLDHKAQFVSNCNDIVLYWVAIKDAQQSAPTDSAIYTRSTTGVTSWSNNISISTNNALAVDCIISEPKSFSWVADSGQTAMTENSSRDYIVQASYEDVDTGTETLGWSWGSSIDPNPGQIHGLVGIWEIGASPAGNPNAAFVGFNT